MSKKQTNKTTRKPDSLKQQRNRRILLFLPLGNILGLKQTEIFFTEKIF